MLKKEGGTFISPPPCGRQWVRLSEDVWRSVSKPRFTLAAGRSRHLTPPLSQLEEKGARRTGQ